MSGKSIWVSDKGQGRGGPYVHDEKPDGPGYSEYRLSSDAENTTERSMANMIALLANAITPLDAHHGYDATGGTVTSLTEAIMGVNAGLVRIADAIASLKDD